MTNPQPFITAPVVASLTGFSNAALFLRKRDYLERVQDFPLPMPGTISPMKWRRVEVEAWVNRQGVPLSAMQATPAPTPDSRSLMQKAAQR